MKNKNNLKLYPSLFKNWGRRTSRTRDSSCMKNTLLSLPSCLLPNSRTALGIYKLVQSIINGGTSDPKRIRALLEQGANPKAVNDNSDISAYSLAAQHNADGSYNALIEIFDEYTSTDSRESDSVGEGMHLKPEEQ